ncbi:Macrophage mannose receptor 1 [Dissostichus eleginoides]|uniref:Macrophage mannose receptor 1 n=1 Tax=Dissostichus eleginoides TaxID=100907 RepID=A0AAD9BUN9_DISEL|nr:Macrophage mannose receptor 1 [Dissostichus eleginoides]
MVWLQGVIPFIASQQYHLINGSLTWYEAQSFCRLKYTDLATVNNMSDKKDLVNTLGSHVTYIWIGLRRGNTHRWMWSDGRGPAHYTRWNVGEPNTNKGSEPCGEMTVGGRWNDIPCGYERDFACYETRADGTERFVIYTGRTWVESQEQCRTKHTDLAYISSASNNTAVANQANSWNNKMWIGLFNDAWMWSDGGETSFRNWLSGSDSGGDCASVAEQGRWVGADCNMKSTFVCHGDLKVKKTVLRMTVRSDVDVTDSTISDALLEKDLVRHTTAGTRTGICKQPKTLDQKSENIIIAGAERPQPVLTVSPSWPSPGASVTLNCRVDHPSAGWSFYWYKAVPQKSDYSYSFELLPGSENGTEQDLFIIDGQTHTAGYVCRAARGDPVFYSWHSKPKFVWSGDMNSAASLTVSPDSVQHFTKTPVSLSCEGNSTEWRVRMFSKPDYLYHCSILGTMIGSTCTITSYRFSGVFWCESETGQFSNAVNITMECICKHPKTLDRKSENIIIAGAGQ